MAGVIAGNPLVGIFALGVGILLQYLFPQKVEGPRQENTKVSTAKFGDVIGHVHGTCRIAGDYIWLEGDQIREQKHKYRAGKGGPVVTEYQYFSTSMAIFDFTGPADAISRVWIDDELVYDNTAEALTSLIAGTPGKGFGTAKGVTFYFYLGTPDQLPFSAMVSDKGASYTPAYRGCVLIVMENLNHEEIGIRLPNLEAEIVKRATYSYQSRVLTSSEYPSGNPNSVFIDHVQKIAVLYNRSLSGSLVNWCWVYNLVDGELLWTKKIEYASGKTGIDGDPVFDGLGGVWFFDRDGRADYYDLFTGARIEEYDFYHSHAAINSQNWNRFRIGDDGLTYAACFRGTKVMFITAPDTVNKWKGQSGIPPYTMPASVDAGIDANTSTRDVTLRLVGATRTLYIVTNYVIYKVDEDGFDISVNLNTRDGTGFLGTVVWCENDDTVIVRAANGLYKLDAYTLDLVSSISDFGSSSSVNIASQVPLTEDGIWWIADDTGASTYYRAINVLTMEEDTTQSIGPVGYSGDVNSPGIAYMESILGFVTKRDSNTAHIDYLPTINRQPIALADVIEAECAFVGLSVDVSDVSATINGYAAKDESTPRGVLEDLCRIYSVDHCQVDGTYKFWDRHNTSALTISSEHVGAAFNDNGFPQEQVEEFIADVMDLPNSFTLTYRAYDASYRQGSQRIDLPLDATESITEASAKTSAALTDNEAAQATDILLRESREVPDTFNFSLPPYYARLHPGDVITIPLENGKTKKVVIEEIEDDLVLKLKTHRRTINYESDAVGQTTADVTGSKINSGTPYFLPMDMNMVRDNTEDDTDGFYFAAYYKGTTVPKAANIFRSTDGGNLYEGWATLTGYATVGLVLTELPDVASPYVPYPEATFDFVIYGGTAPASVTYEEWISEGLVFAVETANSGARTWEIIYVQTITDNGDGTYTATGLVRGQRGTENMTGLHEIGNRFIVLDADYIARVSNGLVASEQRFVPVNAGEEFNVNNAVLFTNYGASLMPFRPVHIEGTRDTGGTETLTVTWQRQTRYNYQWTDGNTEDLPLNETSEVYEVEFYEGATLLRTQTGLTSETTTYTLAQYNTDAGAAESAIPTLTVIVYQISQELVYNSGRGYPGEATV